MNLNAIVSNFEQLSDTTQYNLEECLRNHPQHIQQELKADAEFIREISRISNRSEAELGGLLLALAIAPSFGYPDFSSA